MSRTIRLLAASAAALVAACSVSQHRQDAAPATGLRARRAELAAADRELSTNASADARALGDRSTDDVAFLFGGLRIVQGRGEVVAALDRLATGSLRRLHLNAVRVDVSADGASGYTLGFGARGSDSADVPVRYIAFWRRDAGGRWLVAALALAQGAAESNQLAPAGCETPDADLAPAFVRPRTGTSATAAAPVMDADTQFAADAAARGPGAAFTAFVAPDGITLGGSGPMGCGPAAFAHAFDGAAPGDLTWSPRFGFVARSGDLGFTVGVARFRGAAGEGTSKYLTIWKRQPDGGWRFVADGGSAAPPDA